MIKVWTITDKDSDLYGNHLVTLDPASGEVLNSIWLGAPEEPTTDGTLKQFAKQADALTDENNTALNNAECDGLVAQRDLTVTECKDWGI